MNDANIEDEILKAFKSGSIFNASDKDLNRYLIWLATHPVHNDLVRQNQIIRAQIISTIKTDRYIRKADKTNTFHTYVIIFISVVAIAAQFI